MAGYNHYANCTCGWCVHYGRPTGDRGYSEGHFDKRDAENLLKQYGATRSLTACFVNPNARCPVCGCHVFYYENRFGSRVYFDELGPPWTKHHCTDNESTSEPIYKTAPVPSGRAAGLVAELVSAAKIAESEYVSSGELISREFWLSEIIDSYRQNFTNTVNAIILDHDRRPKIRFRFESDKPRVQTGDIVGLNLSMLSVFDNKRPRKYKIYVISFEY